MIGKPKRGKHTQPCYFPGLPLVNWKRCLPSVNPPPSTRLAGMPHTCSASGRTRWSIWQLTHCLVPGRIGNAGHLGSVFKWCDSSCGKPREWQALTALLTSGKEEWGEQKERFSYTQQLWLEIYARTHHSLAFPTVSSCGRRETLIFLNLKLLVSGSRQNFGPERCPSYNPRNCDYVNFAWQRGIRCQMRQRWFLICF